MKKQYLAIAFFLGLILFTACSSGNNPKDVATHFFTAINAKKFLEAQKYSTKDSKQFLDMLQEMSKQVKDSVPASSERIVVENVKINGDQATADIKTKSQPNPITVNFKKEADQWKVAFDKNSVMKMAGAEAPAGDINADIDKALDSAKGATQMPTRKDTQVIQIQ